MRVPALLLVAAGAMAQPAGITTLDCLAPHTPLLRAERFILDASAEAFTAAVELTNPGTARMAVTLSLDIAGTQRFTSHLLEPGQTRRLHAGSIPRRHWFAPHPPTPAMLREAMVVSCGPAELR